jgi:NAD(P)-dependent dehydrogenase (short-subunit alcohol dehydrogenase family)
MIFSSLIDFQAGLNMAVAVTSRELKDEGIIVYMQCPGHVETDMGGPSVSTSYHSSRSDRQLMQRTLGYFATPRVHLKHVGQDRERHHQRYRFFRRCQR